MLTKNPRKIDLTMPKIFWEDLEKMAEEAKMTLDEICSAIICSVLDETYCLALEKEIKKRNGKE